MTDHQIKLKTLAAIADAAKIKHWAIQLELEWKNEVIKKLQEKIKLLEMYLSN